MYEKLTRHPPDVDGNCISTLKYMAIFLADDSDSVTIGIVL